MTKHLDITGLFSELQYGFRAFRSTADILTVLRACLQFAGCRCRDISNTFDKIRHAGLLHRLKAYGVVGPILSIMGSFLQERSLKVVLDGQFLPLYITNAGVPQGSGLGPTVFLVFINELPDEVPSRIGIYADDTTLYSSLGKSLFLRRGNRLVNLS